MDIIEAVLLPLTLMFFMLCGWVDHLRGMSPDCMDPPPVPCALLYGTQAEVDQCLRTPIPVVNGREPARVMACHIEHRYWKPRADNQCHLDDMPEVGEQG